MQTNLFENAVAQERAGFRLRRFEVYNWGTFHEHVWRLEPDLGNALLTGDIGSGKSTLVDAITTLFVPQHKIVYNKAAGAESKERTLASYLRGEYKNEKDEFTQAAKAVALRDKNTYTVLLANFHNEGYGEDVSIAQVLWLKDQNRQVERFFVVASRPLQIAEDFSGFGNDLLELKRRLKKTPGVHVEDTFRDYAQRLRQGLGIQNEQALDLFYQTISLKTIGNLTDFVRHHMLEASDVKTRVDELRRGFENLNRAHEAILKAKRQIEALSPIVEDGQRYSESAVLRQELRGARDGLAPYFAELKIQLLERKISGLDEDLRKLGAKIDAADEEGRRLQRKETEIRESLREQGGDRIDKIEDEIKDLEIQKQKRQAKAGDYERVASLLSLPAAGNAEVFAANASEAAARLASIEKEMEELRRQETEASASLRLLQEQHEALEKEILSLKRRRSNIPGKNIEIRGELCRDLNLDETDLPFAGELLKVDGREAIWEGAAERVLHGFGLSMLVPEKSYTAVSDYVDRTHLRGRLVYFRVRAKDEASVAAPAERPDSLVNKLQIKPDSPFYDWIERHLWERFNYACCESLDDFRRQPYAITPHGQIKSGGQRHEKDDRTHLHDRRGFVLGWDNKDKILAFEAQKDEISRQGQKLAETLTGLDRRRKLLTGARDAARDLLRFADFAEIDWPAVATRIHDLEQERRALESSSDTIKTLRAQLQKTGEELAALKDKRDELLDGRGSTQNEIVRSEDEKKIAIDKRDSCPHEARAALFPVLERLRAEILGAQAPRLGSLEKNERDLREELQRRIDAEDKRLERTREKIVRQMTNYKRDYPAESKDADPSIDALPEFARMLGLVQSEDLPRHEAKFKQLLNEGTIQSIALFQSQLQKEEHEIRGKIDVINRSLREIEYGSGTYIAMIADSNRDPEIREFREKLRQCLSQGLEDEEFYNEEKFLQIKSMIERFGGREGLSELDRKWTAKVTDVRNWFLFSASERFFHDHAEKEFYSDSSGKSGGQKEKLAYTILASALAYQFGLEWSAERSRTFRFALIDEAFGRGSDESARYGLELFRKLNLQLLIVTPLQKIHVIEDYVRSVFFAHNDGGSRSQVRSLTIDEYRAEKESYRETSS